MTNSTEIMTRYLFGELSEAEQERMEERYFTDPLAFDQLAQLETELLDSYARGQMSAQMRERFERVYLNNPNRRARLKFSKALTARLDQAAASRAAEAPSVKAASWWQQIFLLPTGRQKAFAFSMMLVSLLLAAGVIWLFLQNQRLRQDLVEIQGAQNAQVQQVQDAEQQLAGERTRTQELTDELERARAEAQVQPAPSAPEHSAPIVASLVLLASGLRGIDANTPPKLVILQGTQQVRLQLKLSENDYQRYQLDLKLIGGQELFHRRYPKPPTIKSGAIFSVTLPAAKVSAGDYLLTLKGFTPSGELEDVSQSLFRVEKK